MSPFSFAVAQENGGCSPEAAAVGAAIEGEWITSIETDEGWDGRGESRFEVDQEANCAIIEISDFVLNRGEGDVVRSATRVVYAWDTLSNAWKMLSTDSRGYTHIGFAPHPNKSDWSFEIVAVGGLFPVRRIVFRGLRLRGVDEEIGEFEWVWQGRTATDEP